MSERETEWEGGWETESNIDMESELLVNRTHQNNHEPLHSQRSFKGQSTSTSRITSLLGGYWRRCWRPRRRLPPAARCSSPPDCLLWRTPWTSPPIDRNLQVQLYWVLHRAQFRKYLVSKMVAFLSDNFLHCYRQTPINF